MKKIFASVKHLIILSIMALAYLLISAVCLIEGISALRGGGAAWGWLFAACGMFLALECYIIFDLNRMACRIWLDGDAVKRKGLLFGFYKECKVSLIRAVQIKDFDKDGYYICLIDGSAHKFKRHRKDSYICFESSEKNMLFLRSFWHGKIKECEL